MLSFGFAIGYSFTEEELRLLNNNPDLNFSFLAIGSKIITDKGCVDAVKTNFKTCKAIFAVEDIDLKEIDDKTKLNWARIIKSILTNSSAFHLDEPQFESLLNILLKLIGNLPAAMNTKILNLVRGAIDDLLLYQDKSENIKFRNQQLLKSLNPFFNRLLFAHNENHFKLGHLCVNSLLEAEYVDVTDLADKKYIKNTFQILAQNNAELKKKLWCLYERFSLFPTTNQTPSSFGNLAIDTTYQHNFSK